MSDLPTVSILTLTYNHAAFLKDCIESVLKGRFQDFELIIVDDQSSDNSHAIALEYAAMDNRIRAYRNETNLGDYPNRNKAASLARGKYIKYLDGDDLHGKWALDIMIDAIEQFPEAGFALFDHGPNRPLYPVMLSPQEAYEAYYSGNHDIFNRSPLTAIMRRTAFEEVGGFTGTRYVGDYEMWHTLASRYPMVMMSAWPVFWRQHDQQESSNIRKNEISRLTYLKLSESFLSDSHCPLNNKQKQLRLQQAKQKTARTILYAFRRHGVGSAFRMKAHAERSWLQIFKDALS